MTKAKTDKKTPKDQLQRFRNMAAEVGADPTPGALDRSFGQIDPKAKKPAKAK